MNAASAERAVATSALITAGLYSYRKLVEPADVATRKLTDHRGAQLIGVGPVPPVGQFVTGWGFTYLMLSITAQFAPGAAGAFAILIAVAALLGNGIALTAHINERTQGNDGTIGDLAK